VGAPNVRDDFIAFKGAGTLASPFGFSCVQRR